MYFAHSRARSANVKGFLRSGLEQGTSSAQAWEKRAGLEDRDATSFARIDAPFAHTSVAKIPGSRSLV